MAGAVRTPIGPAAHLRTRRTLEERVYVWWPGLYAALSRTVLRLPPRSRLRRTLLRRSVLSGWAAWARGDLDLMLVRYAPDVRLEPLHEIVAAGMRNSYHGHAGLREVTADWREAWERMDLFPQEIIDAGNPVVIIGRLQLRARGSGIEFDTPVGQVVWAERGLVVRDHFNNWDEALRVAGIPASPKGADTKAGTELSSAQRQSTSPRSANDT